MGGGGPAPSRGSDGSRRIDDVEASEGSAAAAPSGTNGTAASGGSRTPEWTGLAPHPSLLIPTHGSAAGAVGHPYASVHDPSRTEASDNDERANSEGHRMKEVRSPAASSASAATTVGNNVPPQKKHQFYGRRTGSFQESQAEEVRDGIMSPSSASGGGLTSADATSTWLLASQASSNPPTAASSSGVPGHLSPQISAATAALHHAGAAAAAAAAAAAYQTPSYVIDPANSLGLGASAASFGAAAAAAAPGSNWHQPPLHQSAHHQGFFDPVKYQCSYDYSGAVRHPALDPQVNLNNVQHNHSYSAHFGEPPSLLRSHQVPLPISSSSSTGSRGYMSKEESQACRDEKRALQLKIPIPLEEIINLPMDEFNERLSKYDLTEVQLSLIRDIRRRGKNKVAAQNCRKRKLDQILSLADEVTQLRSKRERLGQELDGLIQRRQGLTSRYNALYRHITQHLRDGDGKLLNPYEFMLEHTGEDARVVLMPVNGSAAALAVKDDGSSSAAQSNNPADQHHQHQQHQQQQQQQQQHHAYDQRYVMGPGVYQSDIGPMSYGTPSENFVKREDEMNGPHA